jgi:hypothetical protein
MEEPSKIDWMVAVTTDEFACSSEFANDGGKLIVLPRSLLAIWYGSTFPWTQDLQGFEGARIAEFFEEQLQDFTDFAMAHRTRDWFDVIPLGRGQAIVFGCGHAEIYGRWLRLLPEGQDYLLALEYGDQGIERGVAEFVRRLPAASWADLGLQFDVPDEDLMLFHTGTNGSWLHEVGVDDWAVLGTGIAWKIPPGRYSLYQASAHLTAPGCAGHVEICWLRPV